MNPLILAVAGCVIGLALAFYATGGELRIVHPRVWGYGPIGRLRFVLYWLAILLMVASGALLWQVAIHGM